MTTVIRPEQATITTAEAPDLTARVTSAVFFGTDTHLHLTLCDGQTFVLRRQNRPDQPPPIAGETLGLAVAPGAIRVLEDRGYGVAGTARPGPCACDPGQGDAGGEDASTTDMTLLRQVRDTLTAARPEWLAMDYGTVDNFAAGDLHAGSTPPVAPGRARPCRSTDLRSTAPAGACNPCCTAARCRGRATQG